MIFLNLYKNKNLISFIKGRRLQRDIKKSVDTRLKISEDLSEGRIKVNKNHFSSYFFCVKIRNFLFQPKPIDVRVISHHVQRYAVWLGGSLLGSIVR